MAKTISMTREEFAQVHDQFRPAFLYETDHNGKTVYLVALSPTHTRAYVRKAK